MRAYFVQEVTARQRNDHKTNAYFTLLYTFLYFTVQEVTSLEHTSRRIAVQWNPSARDLQARVVMVITINSDNSDSNSNNIRNRGDCRPVS